MLVYVYIATRQHESEKDLEKLSSWHNEYEFRFIYM